MSPRLLLLALVGSLVAAAPAVAAPARWRWPLPSAAVVAPFHFDRAAPYAPAQRRGLDVRGRPGAAVLAPCSGRVTHAGAVPGGSPWGSGITVRCGALVATALGLAPTVGRGAHVIAGMPVGRLGPAGILRLGARRAGARQGYVDPAPLLAAVPEPAAPPAGRRPRGAPPLAAARRPARPPATSAAPPVGVPVWIGLGLLTAGAAGGARVAIGRRRRMRSGLAAAQR